ncbi:MAG TPA: hypothetical protein VFF40_10480 [Acidimicrobiia bacterium]|nr:hypothetical protein [Acidimicrobiia bacterium]
MSLSLLASEGIQNPDLWYPTLLGFLVVASAIVLFCGSAYLLLATDLGAKLGFLVAAGALSGFMMLLSVLWITSASPLNTVKGRVPQWTPVEVISSDLARSSVPEVTEITAETERLDDAAASNIKAAVDGTVITVSAAEGEVLEPGADEFAQFDSSTEYLMTDAYVLGGGGRFDFSAGGDWPLLHFSFHKPTYAVGTVCPVLEQIVPFGDPAPEAVCDPDGEVINVVFERDLGSLRVPPAVVFVASAILFGLCLAGMHWRERDLAAAKAAEEADDASSGSTSPARTPANA